MDREMSEMQVKLSWLIGEIKLKPTQYIARRILYKESWLEKLGLKERKKFYLVECEFSKIYPVGLEHLYIFSAGESRLKFGPSMLESEL